MLLVVTKLRLLLCRIQEDRRHCVRLLDFVQRVVLYVGHTNRQCPSAAVLVLSGTGILLAPLLCLLDMK